MKIVTKTPHDHGAILYVTKTKHGTYNLWEKNITAGYDARKLVEDATEWEILHYREEQYAGLEFTPAVLHLNFRDVFLPEIIRKA